MINTLGIPKSEEKKFWDLVALANWPSDYNKAKIIYLKKLSKDECKAFRKNVSHARYMVEKSLEENPEINDNLGVGDDGFSDLTHHIVGLGKTEFYKYINNVELIGKLAHSNGYEESFSYCIPYEDDYGKNNDYTIDHVIKMAKKSVEEIDFMQKLDDTRIRWLGNIDFEMDDIKTYFSIFIRNPTLPILENVLIANKDIIIKHCNKIDGFFKNNYMELPRKFTSPRKDGSNFNGICTALFNNTIDDAEKVVDFIKVS